MKMRLKKSTAQSPAMVHKAVRKLRHFARREDGSLLIFGVYVFVLILMVAGIGIDLMRFERDRSNIQYTMDRAVLAAADLDQSLDPVAVVNDYADKAGVAGYLTNVTVTNGAGFRSVTASASSNVETQFMHMNGVDTLVAPATSTAEESIGGVEISLILDVSGSMSRNNRLPNLKVAAKAFIDQVLDSSQPGTASISIIPYATQVNAGEPILSKFNVTNEHAYSNCANFTSNEFSKTTLVPTDPVDRTAHFDPFTYSEDPIALPVCPVRAGTQIVPFSQDRVALKAAIDDMTAGGNTSIDMGMKWGTALLDPSMRGVVTDLIAEGEADAEFAGRPVDYNSGQLKVIVLMTDGQNTDQYYLNPSLREGLSNVWYNEQSNKYSVYHDSGATRYFWPHSGQWKDYPFGNDPDDDPALGDSVRLTYPELFNRTSLAWNVVYNYYYTSSAWATWYRAAFAKRVATAKNQYTKNICSATKDKNVIVFTIGFEAPRAGVNVLKACASSESHFFKAEGAEISEAFESIAGSIRKLRLTQ